MSLSVLFCWIAPVTDFVVLEIVCFSIQILILCLHFTLLVCVGGFLVLIYCFDLTVCDLITMIAVFEWFSVDLFWGARFVCWMALDSDCWFVGVLLCYLVWTCALLAQIRVLVFG